MKVLVVDTELLRAFQYFDKNHTGYLKSHDLQMILHCLGRNLSQHFVKQLISKVVDNNERIYYSKLTDIEKEEEIFS